ncbi:dienelactone hydrolase family protein [Hymenobacter sp. BT770]|uniref:dienelactone hydrolase family protein n=1 Tax=Hymenobacter sp. BT770 TaxID=2886942 RepID=UPI001D0F8D34|nr:dienelactone hydrolase family protein [Hymenobacter sp. BT770]MCC3154668.1 dienelactone hydrolase family protein [Hymenobacter sp. BT770]MDO3416722.1 dienelactone hydrolase family protein [Hymenobacter sp. BT770]
MIRSWHFRTVLFFLLCSLGDAARAGSGFADLKPGPYGVGFRVVQQYDYARSYRDKNDPVTGKAYLGERARPVQTLVWYPAPKAGTPLRYADYMRTEATDEIFGRSAAQIAAFMAERQQWTASRVGPKQAQALLDQRMWAVANAPATTGKFPVVIYAAGGGGAAHEAADLCEYLASHGYVVLASRSLGTHTKSMNFDPEGLATQACDIRFLLSYAHTLPQADVEQVAVAGWSWGGLANALAASQDSRIDALVSFDGTQYKDLTKAVSRTRLALPWLYVQRRPESVRELSADGMETSSILLNEAKYADLYHVVMNPMEHVDFSTAALRVAQLEHFTEYSRPEVEAAYHWTCRYTLEFLNANLQGTAPGRQFLDRTPAQNGVPAHMALQYHLPAQTGPVPTQAGFAAALAQDGFAHALEIYRQVQKQDSAFVLSETDLNNWGYQLIREAHDLPAALAIFRLGTELYPSSFNLFDSLGEADELNHNTAAALTHYRRSLELNPQNRNAQQRLQVLSAPAPAMPAN